MAILALILISNIGVLVRIIKLEQTIKTFISDSNVLLFQKGDIAPELKINGAIDSEKIQKELLRKTHLIVFSSVSCSACRDFWPSLRSFREQFKEVGIIMVSTGTPEEISTMIDLEDFDFPVISWSEDNAKAFRVIGTPALFYIGEDGKIINTGYGNVLNIITKQGFEN